jgi:soluble lytic murein transglycosylase-like protein
MRVRLSPNPPNRTCCACSSPPLAHLAGHPKRHRPIDRSGLSVLAGLLLTGCQTASPPPAASASPTPAAVVVAATLPPPPAVALDPVEVFAAHLVAIESRLRSARTPFIQFQALGQNQQDAYYQLLTHPDWLPRVLEAAPAELRPVVRSNVAAEQELRALNGTASALPHWRIDKPQPPADLLAHYREAERVYGIPWSYFAAINFVESRMGRIHGLSSAGAIGPMQFLPSTWAYYGQGDIYDPRDAILAAGRYLRAHGAPADMGRALYAYNPSDRYVRIIAIYADLMQADERVFLGYYAWQVYVYTPKGDVLLPEGSTT